jgi:hypothetical protein
VGKKTRALTLASVLAALTVVFLYTASVLPTGQLGAVAAASLFTAAAVIETGTGPALCVFAVSCTLGALLLPDKLPVLVYALFFGHYPIIKCFAERKKRAVLRWIAKLATFYAALAVILFFAFDSEVFMTYLRYPETINILIVVLAGGAVFVLYDIGLTKLIGMYIQRVAGRRV